MDAAVAGFLGGVVGSAMFGGGSSHHHTTKTVYVRPENEIIGYHKWLEKRRDEEMAKDEEKITKRIYDLKHICPKCHDKIDFKLQEFMTPEGRTLGVKVGCKCQQFKKMFEIPYFLPYYEMLADKEHYGKDIDEIKSFINECFVKIRGEVDEEKVRRDYMENKLAEKKTMEHYYGRI